jgi:hypothetical protein
MSQQNLPPNQQVHNTSNDEHDKKGLQSQPRWLFYLEILGILGGIIACILAILAFFGIETIEWISDRLKSYPTPMPYTPMNPSSQYKNIIQYMKCLFMG